MSRAPVEDVAAPKPFLGSPGRRRRMRTIGPLLALLLTACQGMPELGQGGSEVSGSAGAAGTQDASEQLVRCPAPLGTAALVEPEGNSATLLQSVGLQSPTPLLRLLMAQSNCFRVIDRGAALANIQTEQTLKQSGMLQGGATTARGRMVTVQWLVTPNVVFSNPNAGGFGGLAALGGLLGTGGAILGAVAGSMRFQEAQTTLFLTDAQTGEQTGVAEGAAKVTDFGGGAGLAGFGGGVAGLGAVGGYGNTAEGKLIAAAYLDAFNKLVAHVRATAPNLPVVTGEVPAPASVSPEAGPASGQAFTPLVRVNIRADPSLSGAVVGTVAPGAILVAAGDGRDGWLPVTGLGLEGWVFARNLAPAR